MEETLQFEKKINKIFYILIGIIIFFTTSDLVCGFTGQPIFASICSVTSAALVFVGYFKIQKTQSEYNFYKITKFIKSNFDKWQIILSVLDVICSFVVIFTSVMTIGMIFRTMILFKILFTPAKIITISNKFKTATKPLLIFCFMWTFLRIKSKIKERKMSNIKLSKTQKVFIIIAFILGVAYSILSATCLPQIAFAEDMLTQIATSLGGTAAIVGAAFIKGKEMTQDEIDKRNAKIAEKETAQQTKIEAKEKAEAEKVEAIRLAKAKALVEKEKAEAEAKAKEEAEQAEIKALAEKIKAEELAKLQDSSVLR